MKRLQITMFVIGFVILSTQSFRHIYVKWIEPRSSVLDPFREPADTAAASATSLDQLVARYQQARAAVQDYETKGNPEVMRHERSETEPYATEMALQNRIEEWEAQSRQIFQLRFFWTIGLLATVLGIWCHQRLNAWLGMAAIIGGFTEMAYWTSPLRRSFGAAMEFERLLSNKLVLSLLAWGLLVALWLVVDRAGKAREGP
jgi:hypothetical protein